MMQSSIRLATYTTVHSVVDRPRNEREKNGVTYVSGRSVVRIPHLDGELGAMEERSERSDTGSHDVSL